MYVGALPVGKLIIQVAPTGNVPTRKQTPHVPLTPDEIAQDTYDAYRLGASIVHVHARDEEGNPTYRKEIFHEIFSRIRSKCPEIIINASTSGRIHPEVQLRTEVLDLNPDMASLTMGSLNFPTQPSVNSMETLRKLAKLMTDRGMIPELEIFESGFINTGKYFLKHGLLKEPLHFTLLLGSLGSIPADIRDLTYLVDSLPPKSVWSATGIGRFQTQVNVASIIMGGHVRIGIEDSIYYDYEKRELATNSKLVERIVRISRELGREVATPKEAREILDLSN